MPYQEYIFKDKLISPVTGYVCRKVTKQNIKQFGFATVDALKVSLPDFPLICDELLSCYLKAGKTGSRKSALIQAEAAQKRIQTKSCQNCGSSFERRTQTKYCSKSCAAIVSNKERLPAIRATQRQTITNRFVASYWEQPKSCERCAIDLPYEHRRRKLCSTCHSNRLVTVTDLIPKTCKCGLETGSPNKKYCGKCRTNVRHYRALCSFNFNVYDFPDDFEISLVGKFGWYSPNGYLRRNKTPNLSGVSRDHLFNVAQGFAERRDPIKLGHPANCRLLIHNGVGGNNSKKQSSISWEQLLQRIVDWDAKH